MLFQRCKFDDPMAGIIVLGLAYNSHIMKMPNLTKNVLSTHRHRAEYDGKEFYHALCLEFRLK